MKLVSYKVGFLFRIGALSAALLFGQQALADGTPAGTPISNTASVDYFVNGVDQDDISSNTVTFLVDRKVTFTLDLVGTELVPVTPGGDDYFVEFLLTNTSNSVLDFILGIDQAGVTTVRGQADTADMDDAEYAASVSPASGTNDDPAQGGPQFVDELAADDSIRIRVWGDAATTLLNGQIAGIQLDATAAEPGTAGTQGAALVLSAADDPNLVDNVFQNPDVNDNATESETDGFIVVTADLTVDKNYTVTDTFGTNFPLPGATVEYTIDVINASTTTPATDVEITDIIDDDVDFVLGQYSGSDVQIDNGGTITTCTADGGDTDDCSYDAGTRTLVVGNGATPITVAASTTLTITFQVVIPDPTVP